LTILVEAVRQLGIQYVHVAAYRLNPVMSALLQNGLDVAALYNHFFWEQPRIFSVRDPDGEES
jgi:integral membrane sensor domain MASE1